MALALDRQAFIDILGEGQGDIGGAMLPPPEGIWGMPPEMLQTAARLRTGRSEEPRRGPRDDAQARLWPGQPPRGEDVRPQCPGLSRCRPSLLIDSSSEIYIDAELEVVETANWFPKMMRKDYKLARRDRHRRSTSPTRNSTKTMSAAPKRNYTGYCDPEIDRLIDRSRWRPTRTSAADWCGRSSAGWRKAVARPVLLYSRFGELQAAPGQGAGDDDQQPLQRLAHGRRLARPITPRRAASVSSDPKATPKYLADPPMPERSDCGGWSKIR